MFAERICWLQLPDKVSPSGELCHAPSVSLIYSTALYCATLCGSVDNLCETPGMVDWTYITCGRHTGECPVLCISTVQNGFVRFTVLYSLVFHTLHSLQLGNREMAQLPKSLANIITTY